jgi:chemotaxis response regulator CheB
VGTRDEETGQDAGPPHAGPDVMTTGPARNLVLVAASAGGLEPLRTQLAGLPANLPERLMRRDVISYECVAGHRWSPQALLEEQTDAVERARGTLRRWRPPARHAAARCARRRPAG